MDHSYFILKIPYSPHVSKRDISSLLQDAIRSIQCPSVLQNHLISKIKIVFTKRKSVESILCNHRKFARSFDVAQPAKCM